MTKTLYFDKPNENRKNTQS